MGTNDDAAAGDSDQGIFNPTAAAPRIQTKHGVRTKPSVRLNATEQTAQQSVSPPPAQAKDDDKKKGVMSDLVIGRMQSLPPHLQNMKLTVKSTYDPRPAPERYRGDEALVPDQRATGENTQRQALFNLTQDVGAARSSVGLSRAQPTPLALEVVGDDQQAPTVSGLYARTRNQDRYALASTSSIADILEADQAHLETLLDGRSSRFLNVLGVTGDDDIFWASKPDGISGTDASAQGDVELVVGASTIRVEPRSSRMRFQRFPASRVINVVSVRARPSDVPLDPVGSSMYEHIHGREDGTTLKSGALASTYDRSDVNQMVQHLVEDTHIKTSAEIQSAAAGAQQRMGYALESQFRDAAGRGTIRRAPTLERPDLSREDAVRLNLTQRDGFPVNPLGKSRRAAAPRANEVVPGAAAVNRRVKAGRLRKRHDMSVRNEEPRSDVVREFRYRDHKLNRSGADARPREYEEKRAQGYRPHYDEFRSKEEYRVNQRAHAVAGLKNYKSDRLVFRANKDSRVSRPGNVRGSRVALDQRMHHGGGPELHGQYAYRVGPSGDRRGGQEVAPDLLVAHAKDSMARTMDRPNLAGSRPSVRLSRLQIVPGLPRAVSNTEYHQGPGYKQVVAKTDDREAANAVRGQRYAPHQELTTRYDPNLDSAQGRQDESRRAPTFADSVPVYENQYAKGVRDQLPRRTPYAPGTIERGRRDVVLDAATDRVHEHVGTTTTYKRDYAFPDRGLNDAPTNEAADQQTRHDQISVQPRDRRDAAVQLGTIDETARPQNLVYAMERDVQQPNKTNGRRDKTVEVYANQLNPTLPTGAADNPHRALHNDRTASSRERTTVDRPLLLRTPEVGHMNGDVLRQVQINGCPAGQPHDAYGDHAVDAKTEVPVEAVRESSARVVMDRVEDPNMTLRVAPMYEQLHADEPAAEESAAAPEAPPAAAEEPTTVAIVPHQSIREIEKQHFYEEPDAEDLAT